MRNTAEMLHMATGIQRISLAVRGLVGKVERVIALAQVIDQVAVLELAAESLAIVRGAVPVLAIVLAEALVLIIAPAEVQAPVIALAEVREPETVQVEAVPVRSHLRARLAVPLRIKSVIGPRRHDQVLPLTVEDLAVEVVETTRDPAVTEAAIAWAAAE